MYQLDRCNRDFWTLKCKLQRRLWVFLELICSFRSLDTRNWKVASSHGSRFSCCYLRNPQATYIITGPMEEGRNILAEEQVDKQARGLADKQARVADKQARVADKQARVLVRFLGHFLLLLPENAIFLFLFSTTRLLMNRSFSIFWVPRSPVSDFQFQSFVFRLLQNLFGDRHVSLSLDAGFPVDTLNSCLSSTSTPLPCEYEF